MENYLKIENCLAYREAGKLEIFIIMLKEITIDNKKIGEGHPCYIIAEIGINHNGSVQIAKQLIDVAVAAGADAIKFQKRSLEHIYTDEMLKNPNLGEQSFQYMIPLLREFELSEKDFLFLKKYCVKRGITFLCTPFDKRSVNFLEKLGVPAYKIGSPDLTNFDLLEKVVKTKKPIIIATGMAYREEIRNTVEFLKKKKARFILLHCSSTYPAPWDKLNLRFMETLKKDFGVLVGYSGHELGISISIVAAALGAAVIERHITLDRAMKGPDHAASLEPQDFKRLVRDIRYTEKALGDGNKYMSRGEILNREVLGKSLVASKPIKKGETITRKMLTAKSPGKGLSPQFIDQLVGKKAKHDFQKDDLFLESDLKIIRRPNFNKRFKSRWGLKVRFHNLDQMMSYNPKIVEFHFTDKDLDYEFGPQKKYGAELYIHAPEYHFRSLNDLCALDPDLREEAIEIMQRTINKTREMKKYFKGPVPKIVFHPGGMSIDPIRNKKQLWKNLENALKKLDTRGIELLPENLPPRPWYFGGQWMDNIFVDLDEIIEFCKRTQLKCTLDLSHAKLYYNLVGKDFYAAIRRIKPYVRELHISDAYGTDGEGLQIEEGEIDWKKISEIFQNYKYGWIPEIWRGHQQEGRGFFIALERLSKYFK